MKPTMKEILCMLIERIAEIEAAKVEPIQDDVTGLERWVAALEEARSRLSEVLRKDRESLDDTKETALAM